MWEKSDPELIINSSQRIKRVRGREGERGGKGSEGRGREAERDGRGNAGGEMRDSRLFLSALRTRKPTNLVPSHIVVVKVD
jgi:hypothetical protein